MPEILFLHKGKHAASTRYRALQYFDCLKCAGWTPKECTAAGPVMSYVQALNAARKADVVVVLKKPFRPFFRRLLRLLSQYLVFDYDDAVYVYDNGTDSHGRMKQFSEILFVCDAVWGGNEELLSVAVPYADNRCLIPTTLACEKYVMQGVKPENSVDLVWIGGSSSRPWLESIMPILDKAAMVIPHLRLKIIADFAVQSQHLEVIPIAWSEETEAQELVQAHIGLAPLPDTPFTRGKCGLKSLQYMAAGLPVIASPVSVQTEIVKHGVTGLLAQTEQEWIEAIASLAGSPILRDEMGQAGRLHCQQEYSLQVGCDKIVQHITGTTQK